LLVELKVEIKVIRLFRKYHDSFKKRGGYTLAWKAILRLLIATVIIVGIFLVLQSTITDFSEHIKVFINHWKPRFVLVLFFVSESLLGLIPPDFFIAWSHQFTHDIAMLSLLGVLSYVGGIVSYLIGLKIGNNKKVNNFFKHRFASHMHKVYQFGGIAIVFSAIFPFPYSVVCMAAGTVKYSFKKLLILGLTRFIRFYGYAIIVYNLI
jgi:membrane protein YqaA with SNARE-associated domain